jgi:hypothetical protein
MMRKSHDEDFITDLTHDHVVREALEREAFGSSLPGPAGHRRQRQNLFLQQVQSGVYRAFEFAAESRAL